MSENVEFSKEIVCAQILYHGFLHLLIVAIATFPSQNLFTLCNVLPMTSRAHELDFL